MDQSISDSGWTLAWGTAFSGRVDRTIGGGPVEGVRGGKRGGAGAEGGADGGGGVYDGEDLTIDGVRDGGGGMLGRFGGGGGGRKDVAGRAFTFSLGGGGAGAGSPL